MLLRRQDPVRRIALGILILLMSCTKLPDPLPLSCAQATFIGTSMLCCDFGKENQCVIGRYLRV